MNRPLLVVDGNSFAHRSYHALPKSIRRRGDKGGGAIVGFANFLLRLYAQEEPRAVLVGWDTLDTPTYRHRALEGYQGGRVFDAELLDQLDVLPQFVTACGFAAAKAPGYEADDFLAAAVAQEERRGGAAVVASGDRDAFQLASERTVILQPVRAGEMARIGPAEVRERYGVDPKQVPDFIALRGDPSDKIPGAPGIGPKTAASLLRRYGSLEAALAQGKFAAQAEQLRLYRSIATMDASAPLPSPTRPNSDLGRGGGPGARVGAEPTGGPPRGAPSGQRLEFAAAIGVIETFGVLARRFLPGVAAAAQGAGEVGRALFVEGLAALLAVRRGLDQQGVDQVLDVPGLVGRQVAEADHELLHHADRDRRQRDDVAGDLFRPLHQLRMGHDLVDEADAQRLVRVEGVVGQQDLHRVDVAELAGSKGWRPGRGRASPATAARI